MVRAVAHALESSAQRLMLALLPLTTQDRCQSTASIVILTCKKNIQDGATRPLSNAAGSEAPSVVRSSAAAMQHLALIDGCRWPVGEQL